MDVVTTSLEALIQRVTNPQNPQKPDIAAIEAFCVTILKETEGVHIASKLLATHIVESSSEWEALQALSLLDTCMRRCGSLFHAEVGKFRFLNELIKLVSPKYLGNSTPVAVREKVLELLYIWTVEYPREMKIKEAFEMLKKQGVVKDELLQSTNAIDGTKAGKSKSQIFEDEEKSKLLQKLLQSKNPDDYQAANKLIKTMVKEDEKRLQQDSRRIMELESVHSNARLLSDMLNSFTPGQANTEDLELMKELHDACGRLKPIILRLANEIQDNEDMLKEVLAANDELDQVFDKYATTLVLNRPTTETSNANITNNSSLLDLSAPNEIISSNNNSTNNETECNNLPTQTDMDILGDIFNSLGTNSSSVPETPPLLPALSMQPINIAATNKTVESAIVKPKGDSKTKGLDDLDELGESLLKESLSFITVKGSFNNASKETSRLPMNSLKKLSAFSTSMQTNNCNIVKETAKSSKDESKLKSESSETKSEITSHDVPMLLNGDESFDNDKSHFLSNKITNKVNKEEMEDNDMPLLSVNNEVEIKPLADISVSLENIKPGSIPPLTVIDEKNGITVVLHFAKDSPRPADVSVVVVTTMSKNSKPLFNYLFQAVVPKKCKCRLQPPSSTELPAHNPFLPPSAITQIVLIANPLKETLSLKFMLSYTMDGETITEMGEVDRLPIV